jgi:hypothetical protein
VSHIFFLKLLLPPCLVAGASLAGRRWGLKIGGALGGFPVTVGPILFFFALEQGPRFAASAALKSLEGMLPFGAFCLVMGWASLRFSLFLSILLGWAVYLGISVLGLNIDLSLLEAAILALLVILIGRPLLPAGPEKKAGASRISSWDIPIRMAATMFLVLSLTGLAHALGPLWSGALAPFPVATSTLAIFARYSDGARGPAGLFKGSLLGSLSFASFCGVLVLALPALSLSLSFLAATAVAMLMQIPALFLTSPKN